MAEEEYELPAHIVVGYKGGRVVIQSHGNDLVGPNWLAFAPEEAREVARKMLELADIAEREAKA